MRVFTSIAMFAMMLILLLLNAAFLYEAFEFQQVGLYFPMAVDLFVVFILTLSMKALYKAEKKYV